MWLTLSSNKKATLARGLCLVDVLGDVGDAAAVVAPHARAPRVAQADDVADDVIVRPLIRHIRAFPHAAEAVVVLDADGFELVVGFHCCSLSFLLMLVEVAHLVLVDAGEAVTADNQTEHNGHSKCGTHTNHCSSEHFLFLLCSFGFGVFLPP